MTPWVFGKPSEGSAKGRSRRPTTGTIQAGVACAAT